jgi:tetratricopeptide (TPR) repeat protein
MSWPAHSKRPPLFPQEQTPSKDALRFRQAQATFAQGDLPEAERLCARILRKRSADFDAWYLLGAIRHAQGRLAEALAAMARALKSNSRSPEALINHGLILCGLDRHQEALASYDHAVEIKPHFAEAHNGRGCVLLDMKRHAEALACFSTALAIRPDYAEALNNRGDALVSLRQPEPAIASLAAALRLQPNHAMAHYNMGNALQQLNRQAEALASYDRALAINPNHAETLSNRGTALYEIGRPVDALASFDRALAIRQDLVEAHNGRGIVLRSLGSYREAAICFDKALEIAPALAEAHLNKGQLQLLLGEMPEGWKEYEHRWDMREFAPQRRAFSEPQWTGREPIEGKTVLLHAEQGFGDTIQFVRYARLLAAKGAEVIIEAQSALVRLLESTYPSVIARGEPLPEFDYHCPMLSAPLACNTDLATIPAGVPYLAVAESGIRSWMERIPRAGRLRAGIAWSGTRAHKFGHDRAMRLAELTPLFALSDVQWISVQKDVRDVDQPALRANRNLTHHGDDLADFADTAALLATLDLVISTDTSVAHLAGALGKPVWIMLARVPDFRWLLDRQDCPWYPTARLFRQPTSGDWASVVAQVRAEIAHFGPAQDQTASLLDDGKRRRQEEQA